MVCTSDPYDGRPPQQARVDERPATWVCHCGQAFPTEQQMRAHAGSAHGGNAKVRQLVATKYCPCCLRSFPTRMKLIIHLQYVRKGKAETGCARFLRQEGHAISKEEADRLDKEDAAWRTAAKATAEGRAALKAPAERLVGPLPPGVLPPGAIMTKPMKTPNQ